MSTKPAPMFTPELLLTRVNLFEPDQARKVGNKTVGNDKYKIEGYFDPTSDEARTFVNTLMGLAKATTDDGVVAVKVIRAAFPTLGEVIEGVRSKRSRSDEEELSKTKKLAAFDKIAERLSAGHNARRLRAATGFGPVSTALANGRDATAKDAFPGVYAEAQVTPNLFQAEFRNGEDMLSLWLGPVLIVRTGERLFGGGPQAKSVFAARINGGRSDLDLGDDEVPF